MDVCIRYVINRKNDFDVGSQLVGGVYRDALEPETVTGATIRQQALAATPITLGDATTAEVFKPYEITLKATDRAGNISTQVFKGMRLNLPELTEESFLLPGSGLYYQPDDLTVTTTNTLNNPTSGGGYLFIGSGGGWDYSSGVSGTSSANWTPVSNPSLIVPGNQADLDSKVSYLAGLRLALTTAQKALSNHPTIAAKKQALIDQLEMLMAVGEVVELNNLFQAMESQSILQGIFKKVHAIDGITKRVAIEKGWQFAKDLAISTKMTLSPPQSNTIVSIKGLAFDIRDKFLILPTPPLQHRSLDVGYLMNQLID
jgi:hypothetical protein